jgi:hypothetical protein
LRRVCARAAKSEATSIAREHPWREATAGPATVRAEESTVVAGISAGRHRVAIAASGQADSRHPKGHDLYYKDYKFLHGAHGFSRRGTLCFSGKQRDHLAMHMTIGRAHLWLIVVDFRVDRASGSKSHAAPRSNRSNTRIELSFLERC